MIRYPEKPDLLSMWHGTRGTVLAASMVVFGVSCVAVATLGAPDFDNLPNRFVVNISQGLEREVSAFRWYVSAFVTSVFFLSLFLLAICATSLVGFVDAAVASHDCASWRLKRRLALTTLLASLPLALVGNLLSAYFQSASR